MNIMKYSSCLLQTTFHSCHCYSNRFKFKGDTKERDDNIPPLSVITGEQPTSFNMYTMSIKSLLLVNLSLCVTSMSF